MNQPKVRSTTQLRDDLEALLAGLAVDDFDVDAEAGAVIDGLGPVSGVGPGLGHAGVGLRDPCEHLNAADVVETLEPPAETLPRS
ncbi:hypothetical protein GCM10010302_74680 [Streptomyces polychromogenes]|uniref:Uncharacterized protein n=1 Tax=Streptomyces polychromogenes TaxID=67342 RepID=A0ABP3FW21_9ACTN